MSNRIVNITEIPRQIKNPRLSAYASIYSAFTIASWSRCAARASRSIKTMMRRSRPSGANGWSAWRDRSQRFQEHLLNAISRRAKPAGWEWHGDLFHFAAMSSDCFYCFNPNQEDYDRFAKAKKDPIQELEQIRAAGMQLNTWR